MPFPEKPRVLFSNNTLDTVICQLRFPPILKIDTESPAEFQELVRGDFPGYSESTQVVVAEPSIIPPEVLSTLGAGKKNYEFISEDHGWKVNLTNHFVALSTSHYVRWERFKDKLMIPVNSLIEAYNPEHFSRVGLRYINIITKSSLGIEHEAWSELIEPYVCGILCESNVGGQVQSFENRTDIQLEDNESIVRLFTRYVSEDDKDDSELKLMIDADFSNDKKTSLDSWSTRLDYFNTRATRLFQWTVKETLYQAMGPTDLPSE